QAAVAGEEHRTRRWLVREECVDAKTVALEGRRRQEEAAGRIAKGDRQVRPRIVAQGVLRLAGVFADESQEQRPRHLVLDLQPWNPSDADRRLIGAPVIRLQL